MSCYSFTGSLPSNLKTIHIEQVKNKYHEENFAPEFTTTVLRAFVDDNTLVTTTKGRADLILKCTIESIREESKSIRINNNQVQSDLNNLTVQVKIICLNTHTNKNIIDNETISLARDIAPTVSISEKNKLIRLMLDEISTQAVDKVIGIW
jgi:hypothetical protein